MQDNQMSDWQRRFEERGSRFERDGETLLSAVGCPLSAGEEDGQTRFFGPILRASPSPFLGKGPDVTCFAAASYAVGCVEVGDFSTPLRCGRNDMKGRSAARVQRVQMVQKVQRVVVAASPQYLGSFS